MIKWYEDEDLTIEFNRIPDVDISFPMPFYGKDKNKAICNKPFLNKEPLDVTIEASGSIFHFDIPAGYGWDGASIPVLFWRIIGSKYNPEFLIPSLLHDVLCENHGYINNDRYLSTMVLVKCLEAVNVPAYKCFLMKHCVDNYQKFCKW